MSNEKSQHNCKVKSTKSVNEVNEDYGGFISNFQELLKNENHK